MNTLFRWLFRKERRRLINTIREREAVIRNKNRNIARLHTENYMLKKQVKELNEHFVYLTYGSMKDAKYDPEIEGTE
jgi:cell division protein FtsB